VCVDFIPIFKVNVQSIYGQDKAILMCSLFSYSCLFNIYKTHDSTFIYNIDTLCICLSLAYINYIAVGDPIMKRGGLGSH